MDVGGGVDVEVPLDGMVAMYAAAAAPATITITTTAMMAVLTAAFLTSCN